MLQVSRFRAALTATVSLLAFIPFIVGEGCPGPVTPINTDVSSAIDTGTGTGTGSGSSNTGNTPPFFSFTSPTEDISLEVGDVFQLTWTASDPDNNASIQILLDPDGTFGNGNERIIVPLILEDSGITTFNVDTGALALSPASYRVVAKVNDGVNPELLVVAPGHILLFGPGLLVGNKAPTIFTRLPDQNVGVSQGDVVNITYCGRDSDNGLGNITPDIVILLDLDTNPNNDLDLKSANAASTLTSICAGALPKAITGAIVLACAKDNDCQGRNNETLLPLTVDVGLIPPTASGLPYHVRSTMWDHTNAPVSSYASGSISVTALASGIVDLANVGRSVSGTRFQGFDSGARAGSTGIGIGDMDGDGADDFVIVERFGVTGSAAGASSTGSGGIGTTSGGGVGTAHLIYGLPKQKFGGQISLNSISVSVRGAFLSMYGGLGPKGGCQIVGDPTVPGLTGTDGLYSVARVNDIRSDGKPSILFGLPFVKQFWDYQDDDPCDCGCPTIDATTQQIVYKGCYADGLPNPLSNSGSCQDDACKSIDKITSFDGGFGFRETEGCSNDLDPFNETSIDGGYAILVSGSVSDNDFQIFDSNLPGGGSVSLNLVGQVMPSGGGAQFSGTRWRGAWMDEFDFTQTTSPTSIIPDNRFGETVNSMPDMLNTRTDISPRFGPTLLVSAPNGAKGKGLVHVMSGGGGNWTSVGSNSLSYPAYSGCAGQCGDFAIVGRGLEFFGGDSILIGAEIGDQLGYAAGAGDFNLDGSRDILAGAPGASRVVNGEQITHGGIVYVIFGRRNFGGVDLGASNPPRMEIRGTNNNDQFGLVQTIVGDINQDGVPDIGFSTPYADGPGGVDSGFIGIVFGGRQLTGENTFTVSQVGTAQLPGCKIYGAQSGGMAGAQLADVGDFNGDGIDDMLVSAPNETMVVNGQSRRGVAYLLFGGPHLINASLSLAQVGTAQLPGLVFVTPYAEGSADEAPIDSVAPAGDVDGDGFADILIGVSQADFVNPLEPGQRRVNAGEMYLIYGSNTGSNTLP